MSITYEEGTQTSYSLGLMMERLINRVNLFLHLMSKVSSNPFVF